MNLFQRFKSLIFNNVQNNLLLFMFNKTIRGICVVIASILNLLVR